MPESASASDKLFPVSSSPVLGTAFSPRPAEREEPSPVSETSLYTGPALR